MKKSVSLLLLTLILSSLSAQLPELVIPVGNMGNVNTLSFSKDSRYLLTSCTDRTVKIWDARRGRILHNLVGHTDDVFSACFISDDRQVLTVSRDKSIKIWDVFTGAVVYSSASPVSVSRQQAISPDGSMVLTYSESGSVDHEIAKVILWSTRTQPWTQLYNIRGGCISHINPFVFSPDLLSFVFLSVDGFIKIADIKNGNVIHTLDKLTDMPDAAYFSPDGNYFLTVSDQSIKIRDAAGESLVSELPGMSYLCFSNDGKKIATISEEEPNMEMIEDQKPNPKSVYKVNISICEFPSGKVLQLIPDSSHIKPIGLSFNRDDSKLLVAYIDATYKLWDLLQNKMNFKIEGMGPVAFSPDGKTLVSCANYSTGYNSPSLDLVPKIWDAQNGKLLHRLSGHVKYISSAKFSPDGKKILTDSDGGAKLWDIRKAKLLYSLRRDSFITKSCEFSPDGKYILKTYANSEFRVWDASDGLLLFSAMIDSMAGKFRRGLNFSAKFSPESKTMVTINENAGLVKVYSLESRKLKYSLNCSFPVKYSTINNDGSLIAVACADGKARIWDLTAGKLKYIIDKSTESPLDSNLSVSNEINEEHENPMQIGENSGFKTINFSPDRRYIITTNENELKIWDGLSGTLLYKPLDYVINISPAPFSPDNKFLIADFYNLQDITSDSSKLQTKIINLSTGEVVKTIAGQTVLQNGTLPNPINPSGNKILSLSAKNKFSLWRFPSGEKLLDLSQDKQERNAGSAFFSPDNRYILSSSFIANNKGYITKYEPLDLWDASTGELLRNINIGSARPADINWKENVICSIVNSKIGVYDINSGKEKFSFVAIDDDDYVFILPSGEYMGTSGGVKYLSWRLNNSLYDFDQWDLQYNRPDKLLEQMGNGDTTLIMMYRKAYEKRLKKAGFSEEMFSPKWHAPETQILNASELGTSVTDPTKLLRIKFYDSDYKLDRFNVWINDVPVEGRNGISLHENPKNSISTEIALKLAQGTNKIQVSCTNEKGVESLKESLEIIYNPKLPAKPNLYIIAFSVSSYKDDRYYLKYAVKDGRDIANLFSSMPGNLDRYNEIYIDTLFNQQATKENFLHLKDKLLKTNADDQLVIFISGHGLLDKDLDFYFGTYDIDFDQPEKRGLSFNEIENVLDGIPAQKKLLMMDACHSGEVDKDELTEPAIAYTASTSDFILRGKVKKYTSRGVTNQSIYPTASLYDSFELMQELFTGLDKGTGTTIISASAGNGYALESAQWNNGVFSFSIINGLKNKMADANKDGKITVSELKEYSIRQVQYLTGGQQKPTARKEPMNNDWRIW